MALTPVPTAPYPMLKAALALARGEGGFLPGLVPSPHSLAFPLCRAHGAPAISFSVVHLVISVRGCGCDLLLPFPHQVPISRSRATL